MSQLREDLLPKPGDVIADHYEIESLLGHGGMGAVYAAKHTRTGRAVAIKWMLPQAATSAEAVARFIAEAKVTARIEHPNVVHIYDFGESNGSPFLVMERLRGRSLREHLDTVGRLSPAEAVHLLVPAMRGVAEAHREGIIHRDIKPDNIFLCQGKDGSAREAKVVDFGISKLFDSDSKSNLTGTGMMMGTPAYMSPEQLNAPKDADARFDVYAFGVVFYEAIVGRQPYEADGIFQLVAQIMNAEVVPPSRVHPELSPALDAVVLRAMHRDAAHRFATMQEMISHFDALRGAVAGSAPGINRPGSAPGVVAVGSAPGTGPVAGQQGTPWPATQMATPPPTGYPHPAPIQAPQQAAQVTPAHARPVHPTAVLNVTPMGTLPGYGTHSGMAAGTPIAPYAAPPKKKGGLLKIVLVGGLALLLGSAAAIGVVGFMSSRDHTDRADHTSEVSTPPPDPTPPPADDSTVVAGLEPAPMEPEVPSGVEPTDVEPPGEPTDPNGAEPTDPDSSAADTPDDDTTDANDRTVTSHGRRRRSHHHPPREPQRPVVRPLTGLTPGVRPIIRPPSRQNPRPQRGANGAMIIE
ncbi:MAG TPA: serine/threonine protein kinase [Polyangiaceae bacterium]|nr:serine/threonine protein kinase [Polyangiaceae bacterium]